MSANLSVLTETKGYSYEQYFAKVFRHFEGAPEAKLRLITGFREDQPAWLRSAAVSELFRAPGLPAEEALPRALSELAVAGESSAEQDAFGLGYQLLISSRWDTAAALSFLEAHPSALTPILMESLGRTGGGRHPFPAGLERELGRAQALTDPAPYVRGLGRWVYGRFQLSEERAESFWSSFDAETRKLLLDGYRRERAWHTLPAASPVARPQ
jgi:hypothetical protein